MGDNNYFLIVARTQKLSRNLNQIAVNLKKEAKHQFLYNFNRMCDLAHYFQLYPKFFMANYFFSGAAKNRYSLGRNNNQFALLE